MSNKAPNISLPQGGGALNGIGEKFSADLFTGTGNFSVPIAVPPGRNGLAPQLGLGYSTGNGNGPWGLGWGLSIPGVMRKTDKGIPVYNDEEDIFILSGAEDLIPVYKTPITNVDGVVTGYSTLYRPRTEGLFARIEHIKDSVKGNYWQVKSKDGLTSYYGTPNAGADDPAILADPENRSHICSWQLSKTVDPFGNHILYRYERELSYTQPHIYDQLYLSEIVYCDYGDPSDPDGYLMQVKFNYENRQDAFSTYRQGFELRTTKRCSSIETYIHSDPQNPTKTKTLHFTYLDEILPEDAWPENHVSLLSKVEIEGHNGEESEWMPPLEFNYSNFEPKGKDFYPVEGSIPSYGLASPNLELVDLTGNGLPDILEMNGSVRWYRNKGNATFDFPREMQEAPAGLELADPDVQMLDANGDGRADLLVNKPGLAGYYSTKFGGGWDKRYFQQYQSAPSFSFSDPQVRLMDLDGNGVTDALRIGAQTLDCFYNDKEKGFYKVSQQPSAQLDGIGNLNFTDPRIRLADMSGDGLQDIVMIYHNQVSYWPNLGYGKFGKRVIMRGGLNLPADYDPVRLLLGDIDGDGCADLVYVENGSLKLWMNRNGNSFSDRIDIKGTPQVTNMDSVRLADITGSGVSGILWTGAVATDRKSSYYLDFTAGNKPYLLQEMNNNMGSVTRVEYKSSLHYYLEDEKNPETRWKTELPFPVLVVSKVEAIDQISQGKLTTEYFYHHGYWDGFEREFRGFGRVDQKDTETFDRYNADGLAGKKPFERVSSIHYTPPMLTKTWFHQGAMGEPFGGFYEADFSAEFWSGDPQGLKRPAEVTNLLQNLSAWDKRDALRTLRGTAIRSEVYALDGTPQQTRPYTVSESLSGMRLETRIGGEHSFLKVNGKVPEINEKLQKNHRTYKIFFPYNIAQRSTQWERGNEPMTSVSRTGRYDSYGQSLETASLGVPKSGNWRRGGGSTEPYLATLATSENIYVDEPGQYMVNRPLTGRSWDATGSSSTPAIEYLEKLLTDAANDTVNLPLLSHSINYYDGAAFTGLPYGEIGDYGLQVRSESLVIDDAILTAVYGSNIPPCFSGTGTPSWDTDVYPQAFIDALQDERLGYAYKNSGEYVTGYYVSPGSVKFDFQDASVLNPRGLVLESKDTFGATGAVEYDQFYLLPVQTTDALGLITTAEYDYRVLQPSIVTDPNGNRSLAAYTPLGLVYKTAIQGKIGENKGDTLDHPTALLEYDFFNFLYNGDPVWVKTSARERHYYDDANSPYIVKVDYSDGFGRLLQSRAQAEDVFFGGTAFGDSGLSSDPDEYNKMATGHKRSGTDPENVLVSGWQVYNNKGKVVEKYEPFFQRPVAEQFLDTFTKTLGGWGPYAELDNGRAKVTINTMHNKYFQKIFTTVPGKKYRFTFGLQLGANPSVKVQAWGLDYLTEPPSQWTRDFQNWYYSDGSQTGTFIASNSIAAISFQPTTENNDPFWLDSFLLEEVLEGFDPWDYRKPTEMQTGQKVQMFYDPRGQVVRTLNPDGTEQKVVYGRPYDPKYPDSYEPTPWVSCSYDANDLTPSLLAFGTPKYGYIDALGRVTETYEKNIYHDPIDDQDKEQDIRMRYSYDIRGNLLQVTDALDRVAFSHVYDFANRSLKSNHIDSGTSIGLPDALNRPVFAIDAKDAVVLSVYDIASRPLKMWALDNGFDYNASAPDPNPFTLRMLTQYGDSSGLTDPEDQNLLGQVWRSYDEAGRMETPEYDFKGNPLESSRRVIKVSEVMSVFNGPPANWQVEAYRVNWDPTDLPALLDSKDYTTNMQYDALNRVTRMEYPEASADNKRRILLPTYNNAGGLDKVDMKDDDASTAVNYIERIAYNARGQKLLMALGNGLMTRYVYDDRNFRLLRFKTEKYTKAETTNLINYTPNSGTTRQDYGYEYDLLGNILKILDETPNGGIGGVTGLERNFSYDALYRLLKATGRENGPATTDPYQDDTRSEDPNSTTGYTQKYQYDEMGNIIELNHDTSTGTGNFTRQFGYFDLQASNKLEDVTIGNTTYSFSYDACGNQTGQNTERHMQWDAANRMKAFYIQVGTDQPTKFAQYLYDAGGNRVMKVVRVTGGNYTVRLYLGGIEEYYEVDSGVNQGWQTEIDMAGSAKKRIGNAYGDTTPAIRYMLTDQIDSCTAICDDTGALVNREEYYPFGETSFGSYAKKRYRFAGKERDDESGLYYFGARYYLPWTCRFVSVDPMAGKYAYQSSYVYADDNPVVLTDFMGLGTDGVKGNGSGGGESVVNNTGGGDELNPENVYGQPPAAVLGNTWSFKNGTLTYTEYGWIDLSLTATVKSPLSTLDYIKIGADVLSFIPVVGTLGDVAALAIAVYEGNTTDIIAAGVGFLPFGDLLKPLIKNARKLGKIFKKADDIPLNKTDDMSEASKTVPDVPSSSTVESPMVTKSNSEPARKIENSSKSKDPTASPPASTVKQHYDFQAPSNRFSNWPKANQYEKKVANMIDGNFPGRIIGVGIDVLDPNTGRKLTDIDIFTKTEWIEVASGKKKIKQIEAQMKLAKERNLEYLVIASPDLQGSIEKIIREELKVPIFRNVQEAMIYIKNKH